MFHTLVTRADPSLPQLLDFTEILRFLVWVRAHEFALPNADARYIDVSSFFGDSAMRTQSATILATASSMRALAAVKEARLKQNAAIARHDVEEIASFWTDDVTICRGLGAQVAGKDQYRKLFEEGSPGSPDVLVYERIPTAIDVGSPWPLAFETGVWKGHRGSSTGPVVIRGRYSAQWVERSNKWLIRSEVFVALEGLGSELEMKAAP
jgi:ketosteroid isomerase-like protein